jgi:hypothetical protein
MLFGAFWWCGCGLNKIEIFLIQISMLYHTLIMLIAVSARPTDVSQAAQAPLSEGAFNVINTLMYRDDNFNESHARKQGSVELKAGQPSAAITEITTSSKLAAGAQDVINTLMYRDENYKLKPGQSSAATIDDSVGIRIPE